MKIRAAEEVGIAFNHIALPAEARVEDIVDVVRKLNDDDAVSGILVQLPLGPHVGPDGERTVTEAVSPQKDVDGYAPAALSRPSMADVSPCPASMHTISDTCRRALPCLSSPRALRLASSVSWNPPASPSPAQTLSSSAAATSSAAPSPPCSATRTPPSPNVTAVQKISRKS